MPLQTKFYIAAYDSGGSKLRARVADSEGKVISKVERAISGVNGEGLPKVTGDCLEEAIKQAEAQSGNVEISAIAGSQAGVIDRNNGVVVLSPNVKEGINIQMGPYLTDRFKVPFWLENDADAAAYGVLKTDPQAKGMKHIVYIVMGTGIGGGIIINGEIYSGVGGGGEAGHTIVVINGRICGCGKRGCWEAYCSGSGLEKSAIEEEAVAQSIRKTLGITGEIKAKDVFEAMRRGNNAARHVINSLGNYNAIAVSNLINLLRPEAVFIGESVAKNNSEVLQMLQERVPPLLLPSVRETQILKTQADDPGLMGAIYLAIDRYKRTYI